MPDQRTLPHGEWPSPISAADVAESGVSLGFVDSLGDEVWWGETRPAEDGRATVVRRTSDGTVVDALPAPWHARSRVHEYGGKAWLPLPGVGGDEPSLVFANWDDQRLYILEPGTSAPRALTPEPTEPGALRYADPVLSADGREVHCVREQHSAGRVTRRIVAVPLDGTRVGGRDRGAGGGRRQRLPRSPAHLPRRPAHRLARVGPPADAVGGHRAARRRPRGRGRDAGPDRARRARGVGAAAGVGRRLDAVRRVGPDRLVEPLPARRRRARQRRPDREEARPRAALSRGTRSSASRCGCWATRPTACSTTGGSRSSTAPAPTPSACSTRRRGSSPTWTCRSPCGSRRRRWWATTSPPSSGSATEPLTVVRINLASGDVRAAAAVAGPGSRPGVPAGAAVRGAARSERASRARARLPAAQPRCAAAER